MSDPNKLGVSRKAKKSESSRDAIKQSLQAIKYRDNGFRGAKASLVVSAAPEQSSSVVSVKQEDNLMSDQDLTRAVAKILESRMQNTAQQHDHLLDESQSLSAVVQFKYTFRKKPTAEEKQAFGDSAIADNVPVAPLDVQFDDAYWSKAFGNKIDFSKTGTYALSGYVESVYSTAPVELNWTLNGIQGRPVERVHSSNGQAVTMSILPGMNLVTEKPLFRLKDINTKHLFKHGNLDMQAELDALVPISNSMLLVDPTRKLGKILKRNEAALFKKEDGSAGELQVIPNIDMYAVHEDVLVDVLDALNDQVLSELKTTSFPDIVGTLTRADRTESEASTREFADFSDAPGLTKAGRQAAHSTTHQVVINVRLHAIDPAKFEKQEE